MPLESPQGPRWPEPLASRLGADAGVEQVVDTIMAIWREIEQALNPIVGQHGVAALFNRSLKLVAATHPWLVAGRGGALDAVDPSALRALLLQQPAATAADGGAALFRSFHDLLASLVGAPLTNRLLHSVWAPPKGATPAQDLLP
jgi:hypothetical protein